MEDHQLLSAWASGDSEAGGELYRRYVDDLLVYFTGLVGVSDRADLTQSTFERLIRARDHFAGRSSFRSYLFGIARNVFLEHLRSRYKGPGQFDELRQSVLDIEAMTPSTGVRLLRDHQRLYHCLASLPAEDQALLTLYVWQDFTAAELAEVFFVKEGTVRTRISRIRKALARMMEPTGAPAPQAESDLDDELRRLRDTIAGGPAPMDRTDEW